MTVNKNMFISLLQKLIMHNIETKDFQASHPAHILRARHSTVFNFGSIDIVFYIHHAVL